MNKCKVKKCKWGRDIKGCIFCNSNGICITLEDCPKLEKPTEGDK